ncbi:MAG: methyltransferase domain-containing protein [Immundisolibacterales bacterium]|nr:methyltransferase domain-containing protein [Immundisolibacterales bacterium]
MPEQPLMSLDEIRDRLDLGDTQMLEWLATRASLVREVARIKEAKGVSLQSADREASMFARKQIQCRVLGLDFHYVAELVSLMIWHSKQIECDELGRDTFLDTNPVSPERLHEQLLELTAVEAPRYDTYLRGEGADAVSSYIDRELESIESAAREAPNRALALDLGCATGQVAEFLESRFERVRGFDISPAMIEHARARRDWSGGVELEVRDLDDGIPAGDGTVSFAVANFGAASELAADLPRELARVLRPGGTAVLSWYNRDALVNEWFYPWPATVHSHLNPHNDTLEVWSGGSVYTIRARAMTVDGARRACESAGLEFRLAGTYPTLQPILPAFVARSPRARALYDACRQLDDHLAAPGVDRGSCIIAVVARPNG